MTLESGCADRADYEGQYATSIVHQIAVKCFDFTLSLACVMQLNNHIKGVAI